MVLSCGFVQPGGALLLVLCKGMVHPVLVHKVLHFQMEGNDTEDKVRRAVSPLAEWKAAHCSLYQQQAGGRWMCQIQGTPNLLSPWISHILPLVQSAPPHLIVGVNREAEVWESDVDSSVGEAPANHSSLLHMSPLPI